MPAPTPKRPEFRLPLWIRVCLWGGGIVMALGFLLSLSPLVLTPLVFINGAQYDTRLLFSEEALAVVHLDGDLEDPGVAAMSGYLLGMLPELKGAQRRSQGAPDLIVQLDEERTRMKALEQWVDMPRQLTASLEPGADDQAPGWLMAVNPAQLGRMFEWTTWLTATFMSEKVDSSGQPVMGRVEHGGRTLFFTHERDGEASFVFDTLDSTMILGRGREPVLARAMVRLLDGDAPAGPLHAVVASIEPPRWDLWGGALLGPTTLAGVDLAQGSCLEDLDPHTTPALVWGVDLLDEERLEGELRLLHPVGAMPPTAGGCLRQLCEDPDLDLLVQGLSLDCEVSQEPGLSVSRFEVRGLDRFIYGQVEGLGSP